MPEAREQFEQIVTQFNPIVADLARSARALIYDVLRGTWEVPWLQQRIIGYGTGPKKMSEHFSWIAPLRIYISLGFYYGTELPDPNSLLEGTGKLLRHVKLRSQADLAHPGVRALLEAAIHHRVPPPKHP